MESYFTFNMKHFAEIVNDYAVNYACKILNFRFLIEF